MAEPALALTEDPWPPQGQWTWDDYLRLPEDGRRYEIIEGVLYVAAAPTFDHQFSVSKLDRVMGSLVDEQALGMVLVAPFDIRLPGLADPVQPDLVFFRTGNEPRAGDAFFMGVPDLVVEVLSPSTRRLDQGVKLAAYERAGVSEYWMVDTENRTITVLGLDAKTKRYQEVGVFGVGQKVRSTVLQGFETPITPLFPPRFQS